MQSLDAPASSLLLSQTSSDKLFGVSNRLSYAQISQKRIFSKAYYYKVGTSHTALKCYFSCLIAHYLQSSLFIAKYQTHLELQAQGDFQ